MNIPTEWQAIAPTTQELTETERKVERLRQAGYTDGMICCRMGIRREHLHEVIYEINRNKAIAARVAAETEEKVMRGKLTPEQRAQVVEMAQQGVVQKDIAQKMGVTPAAVCQIIAAARTRSELGLAERAETPQEAAREPQEERAVQVSAPENGTAESTLERIGETAQRLMTDEGREYIKRSLNGEASEAEERRQAERAVRVLADAARDRIRADEAEIERQEAVIREARKRLMAAAQEIDDLKAWLREQGETVTHEAEGGTA